MSIWQMSACSNIQDFTKLHIYLGYASLCSIVSCAWNAPCSFQNYAIGRQRCYNHKSRSENPMSDPRRNNTSGWQEIPNKLLASCLVNWSHYWVGQSWDPSERASHTHLQSSIVLQIHTFSFQGLLLTWDTQEGTKAESTSKLLMP